MKVSKLDPVNETEHPPKVCKIAIVSYLILEVQVGIVTDLLAVLVESF